MLLAISALKLASINLLNEITHTDITTKNIAAKTKISFFVIDKISPTRYPEYLENPPFADKITIPTAIPAKHPILLY